MRGYFEIGIYNTKTAVNVGTLWRSAYQLGAAGIFTIGKRYSHQVSDTTRTYRHIPMREFLTFDDFIKFRPKDACIVGVEMDGRPLSKYYHPEQAIYLLGAEDYGLPDNIIRQCDFVISIETIRIESFNVAIAGSIVMYHRYLQNIINKGRAGSNSLSP